MTFLEELREQRWDDHRFYHQSMVNQSIHFLSACCFLATYVLLAVNPMVAVLFGWPIAMWCRQIGHFFFEPKGYDKVNQTSFEHKEKVKVGFNLQRKVLLFCTWATVPVLLALSHTFFGLFAPWHDLHGYLDILWRLWLGLAAAGLVGRTIWLCATRSLQTGLVWITKIFTDPFHDILIYHRSPLRLMRGEWFDTMEEGRPS
jgi:hypothetical protein